MTFDQMTQGCPEHGDYPRVACRYCYALNTSMALRRIQADLQDIRNEVRLKLFKEEYRPDRDDRPASVTDEIDRVIAEWMRGEVDAT